MFKIFKEKILRLIYPPRCIFCSCLTYLDCDICEKCTDIIKIDISVRCIAEFNGEVIYCFSPLKYENLTREAICRFKFASCKNYAYTFARIICDNFRKSNLYMNFDLISSVPLSRKRKRNRGYNQSECLGRNISCFLGIEYKELLIKTKDNFAQHKLPFSERIENVKDVYYPLDLKFIKGKNILLCDDIVTTGSTLKECVKVLKFYGAKNVVCCTIAYVH